MEGGAKQGNGGARPSSSSSKGGSSWAKVAGGQQRQGSWTAHKVSNEEVDQLWQYFTKILEFPEEEMNDAKGEWDWKAVLAWSLGRQVLVDWIARDFKT